MPRWRFIRGWVTDFDALAATRCVLARYNGHPSDQHRELKIRVVNSTSPNNVRLGTRVVNSEIQGCFSTALPDVGRHDAGRLRPGLLGPLVDQAQRLADLRVDRGPEPFPGLVADLRQ